MIKKNTVASVVGRRNKQSILRDFVRPNASNIVSSPTITTSPYSGNIPGCAGGGNTPRNPCGEFSQDHGTGLIAGAWNSGGHGSHWFMYPTCTSEQECWGTPGSPCSFVNFYPSNDFCFTGEISGPGYITSAQDGDPLTYRYLAGILNTPLAQYRAEPSGGSGSPVRFFGAGWRASGAALINFSTQELFPYETLVKFTFDKIIDERPDEGSGGVIFSFEKFEEEEYAEGNGFFSSGVIVEVVIRPKILVGTHSNDYLLVRHNGTAGAGAFTSPDVEFPVMEGCGGVNVAEGATYYLRVNVERGATSAKVWLADEPEPEEYSRTVSGSALPDTYEPGFSAYLGGQTASSTPSIGTPSLDFPDQRQQVAVHALTINPVAFGQPCDDEIDDGPGTYMDTLIKHSAYWLPASDNVSYYTQVYFDGIPVFLNTHYWLDGLKLYPKDPAIFADTIATATVVVQ